jgi:C4-dicarboxylate-specific signal transduction histidine kinase
MTEMQTDANELTRKKIAFFGRIMANVSHEFNNVITVISELAGLLKDFSLMAQRGREIPPEKITSISDNISKQVARGKHLVSHMNRFSHSTDEQDAQVDLGDVVENMQVLTDRLFKNSRKCTTFSPPEEACSLRTDPFELRRILFVCLDKFLDSSSNEVSIQIKRPKNGEGLELEISGEGENVNSKFTEQLEDLKEHTADLKGGLTFEQTGTRIRVRLVFPTNHN